MCKSSTPLVETEIDSTVNNNSIVNSSFQYSNTFDTIYLSLFVICVIVFTFLVHKLYVKMGKIETDLMSFILSCRFNVKNEFESQHQSL